MKYETNKSVLDEMRIITDREEDIVTVLLKRQFRKVPKFLMRSKLFRTLHRKIFKYEIRRTWVTPKKKELWREKVSIVKDGKVIDSIIFTISGQPEE